jgi:PTS system nitrogen regulatory IIA component
MYENLFHPGTVVIELKNTEKYEAIREIISQARVFDDLSDKTLFEEAVIARERAQSTGLGRGVAFAHGKLTEIRHMKLALGVSRGGIDFRSVDGLPVHLLFVVATHPSMHIDYLHCLASLARMVRREGFREEILSCCREEEVENKLCACFS